MVYTHAIGKKITGSALVLAMLLAFASPFQGLAAGSLAAYGTDTVAGYSALLRTSQTEPGREVTIQVQKPDGALVNIPATTATKGVATVNLYDYHTRKAGEYKVRAFAAGHTAQGAFSSFKVYPDEVSAKDSTVVASTGIGRANGEEVAVTVRLVDQYGNPFSGHSVQLISSRSADEVIAARPLGMTDSNGDATFVVRSYEPGVSVLSAFDATAGVVLEAREQVAFLKEMGIAADIGGSLDQFFPPAAAQGSGPLHHFEIGDIPSSIAPGQDVSFSVTAQDQNDLTVENYTGTVRFSAEGSGSDNVDLPQDYTFKAEDLGKHTFSLGLSFKIAGTYTVVVADLNNPLIQGEKTIAVGSGSSAGSTVSGGPSIITPVAGSYSQSTQTISGSAPAGTTIKVFDNDQPIGSVDVLSSGSYSFQAEALADGNHSFYVVTTDASGTVIATSETVSITIDTTAPVVDEVIINPSSGITPGTVLNVRVLSEPNLFEAAVVFNADIFPLAEAVDGNGYVASLPAPSVPGEYPMDVLLVDELGNEEIYKAVAAVTVSPDGSGTVTESVTTAPVQDDASVDGPEDTLESELAAGMPPSQVFGVIAYGSDQRVTLVWEAALDDKTIDHYRIYYGLDPAQLTESVDTIDASTTWYVPNLENGEEYFFAVSAVDDEGLESLVQSELVNGIPFQLEVERSLPDRPEAALGVGAGDALLRSAAPPPEMVKNGPGLLWLLLGSGVAGGLARKLSTRSRRR